MAKPINLSCRTNACFNIPLDELVETVFDMREELLVCVRDMHENIKFFNGCYSIYLTDWWQAHVGEQKDALPTFVCVVGSFCVNDPNHLYLSIVEGYKYEGYKYHGEPGFCDTDKFLEIKPNRESLLHALDAIKNGTLPLHNTNVEITETLYPYALIQ